MYVYVLGIKPLRQLCKIFFKFIMYCSLPQYHYQHKLPLLVKGRDIGVQEGVEEALVDHAQLQFAAQIQITVLPQTTSNHITLILREEETILIFMPITVPTIFRLIFRLITFHLI